MNMDEMLKMLKDESFRLAVALHEAAHVWYARRAGAIDVEFYGPLEYPGRPGEFGLAGVVPVFPSS